MPRFGSPYNRQVAFKSFEGAKPFDGDAYALEVWIQAMTTLFKLHLVPEGFKVIMASLALSGSVLLWWKARHPDNEEKVEWEQMVSELRAKYSTKEVEQERRTQDYIVKLEKWEMLEGETLLDYTDRFYETIYMVKPDSVEDSELIDFFLVHLPRSYDNLQHERPDNNDFVVFIDFILTKGLEELNGRACSPTHTAQPSQKVGGEDNENPNQPMEQEDEEEEDPSEDPCSSEESVNYYGTGVINIDN